MKPVPERAAKVIFSIVRYFPQGIVYFLAKKEKIGDEWYDGGMGKVEKVHGHTLTSKIRVRQKLR